MTNFNLSYQVIAVQFQRVSVQKFPNLSSVIKILLYILSESMIIGDIQKIA